MKIDTTDAAFYAPCREDDKFSFKDWDVWHWFWAKVFGRRVATSGDRAHIGNLLLVYNPAYKNDPFTPDNFHTDAQRVHRLGDLYIFDYGDTKLETVETSYKMPKKDLARNNKSLLKENAKKYKYDIFANN